MSAHDRIPYAGALAIAEDLVARLAPQCERIQIAGSLRRKLATVGDVELVAIPQTVQDRDLFDQPIGAPRCLLDDALAELDAGWLIKWRKNGPAFKQFEYRGMSIDLFLVQPATWGIQYLIRTGGEEFSHWMVTAQSAKGALPFGYQVRDGRLWHLGQLVDTPEETDVFAAIGLPYIPPEQRSGHGWFMRGGK